MSNEIKFRIFEMLATKNGQLKLADILRNFEKSYEKLYIADIVIVDMVACNQIRYYSEFGKKYIFPKSSSDMYLSDRIRYYDD